MPGSRDDECRRRAKLMQRHEADILENARIYSGSCDACTRNGYIVFIPHHVCAYMKPVVPRARSPSLSPNSRVIGSSRANPRDDGGRERQFARTADNISGWTRGKRARGPEGHSEISGTARGVVLRLFGDRAPRIRRG